MKEIALPYQRDESDGVGNCICPFVEGKCSVKDHTKALLYVLYLCHMVPTVLNQFCFQ